MRLVLDTSVLVSAVRSRRGASAELVLMSLRGQVDLALSAPLMLEYEAVLKRSEHLRVSGFTSADVDLLLLRLSQSSIHVQLGPFRRSILTDPDDEHVVNLAWRSRADILVTQNIRHFLPVAETLGIHCCLPGEAVRLWENEDGKRRDSST